MVRVKELDKLKDRKFWYFDYQGKEFPVSLITKKGYVVMHDDGKGNTMWLIRKKHCEEIN